MPTWYTRQSSAEIVTDQVIEASDFNNEYNAIASAFMNVSSYVVYQDGLLTTADANLTSYIAFVAASASSYTAYLGSFNLYNTSSYIAFVNTSLSSYISYVSSYGLYYTDAAVPPWTTVTGSYLITSGQRILADTSTGSYTIGAPSAAVDNVKFSVADYARTFNTAPVHLIGSFVGVTGTFVLDIQGLSVDFVSKNSLFRMV